MANLKQTIKDLGYSSDNLAERWGKTRRRINQILKDPSQMHIDAVAGLSVKHRTSNRGGEWGKI